MYKKCQHFTPIDIANEMLDSIGYIDDLFGKKILENACGDGRILKLIIERYIKNALANNYCKSTIIEGLENDVYGYEIDFYVYEKCIQNLNELVYSYGFEEIKWKVFNIDFLKNYKNCYFDFVVGNPPYITYRELDKNNREFIKDEFETCSIGKFDYSYAFIEASYKSLKSKAKMGYLIPSNTFKNVFGQKVREFIKSDVLEIYDYKYIKLFDEALTSSAVIVLEKDSNCNVMRYHSVEEKRQDIILKDVLEDKWIFLNQSIRNGSKRFGDYFDVSLSVATLYNKAFVIENYEQDDTYYYVDGNKIEKDIVRPGVSPRSLAYNKKYLIIYPYDYNDKNILVRYEEIDFIEKYPHTVDYLSNFKEKLYKRAADDKSKWYEYGRSQAIAHLNQDKLLMSTLITGQVNVYKLSKNQIPYSGLYIVPKKNMTLSQAKKILKSREFFDYACRIGINASGNSVRVTSKDIRNYKF